MTTKKTILAINGSASKASSNLRLLEFLVHQMHDEFQWETLESLAHLPHFSPKESLENTPDEICDFRRRIEKADAIVICTPEYVFSIPSGLKNAIEWCVSTTVFDNKPCGLITFSASGEKGHEELQLIMRTVGAIFTPETTLLIKGIKGKIDTSGLINDAATLDVLKNFIESFKNFLQRRV